MGKLKETERARKGFLEEFLGDLWNMSKCLWGAFVRMEDGGRKVFAFQPEGIMWPKTQKWERETALENCMHLVMQGFTVLQEAEGFLHDKEFRLHRTLLVKRNKHTEDFGQQKNLLMHAEALFMELIATHCPSITKESISSLQKTKQNKKKSSGNVSQWFSTFYSPFLSSPWECCKESFLLLFKQK